jgi:hypothetical protein
MDILKDLKEIKEILASIDVSLQLLANKSERRTTCFVNKKTICHRLHIPAITLDKLIHQGIVSNGKYGIVEGTHYCRISPEEKNSSKFLFDPYAILDAAWRNFKNE